MSRRLDVLFCALMGGFVVASLVMPSTGAPPGAPPDALAPPEAIQGEAMGGWIRDSDASWEPWTAAGGTDLEGHTAPDLATGPSGRIYAVFEELDDETGDIDVVLQYTDDGGVSWIGQSSALASSAFPVAANPAVDERAPSVAVDPVGGRVWVGYESWTSPGQASILVAYADFPTLDTWTPVTPVFLEGCPLQCFWARHPDLTLEAVSSDRFLYIAFEGHSDLGPYPAAQVYGTKDDGTTWTDVYDAGAPGSAQVRPQLVIGNGTGGADDKRGYLVYAFGPDETTLQEIRVENTTATAGLLLNDEVNGPWPSGTVLYDGNPTATTVDFPTIAASRGESTLLVAWEANRTASAPAYGYDIGLASTTDRGVGWIPSTGLYSLLGDERQPRLVADGEGTTDALTGGAYHLLYQREDGPTGTLVYRGQPVDLAGAWTSEGVVSDIAARPSFDRMGTAVATQLRPDGRWYPVVGWADYRHTLADYDIFVSTPGGDLSIGTTPEGLDFGIDLAPYATRQQSTIAAGFSRDVNTTSPQSGGVDTRYVLSLWTDSIFSTLPPSFTYWMPPGDWNLTAFFDTEFQVTVDTTPSGLAIDVDALPQVAPYTLWYSGNSAVNLSAPSPQPAVPGVRYSWSSWSDSGGRVHDAPVTGPGTFTATFATEYETLLGTNPSGFTLTVDGANLTAPAALWWPQGTVHTLAVPSPQAGLAGTRYAFASWSDSGAQDRTVTASGPRTLTANLTAEHLVVLDTDPAGLTLEIDGTPATAPASYWWANGTSHAVAVPSPVSGGTGTRLVWQNWSDGGLQNRTVVVDGPRTLNADYATQYEIVVDTDPPGLDFEVDGVGHTGPFSLWVTAGSPHELNVTDNATADSRYLFASWSDAGARNHSVAVNGPGRYVATFTHEFRVTLDTGPSGIALTVDGSTVPTPATFWWAEGGVHSVEADPVQGGLYFVRWSDLAPRQRTITVAGPMTLIASYSVLPQPLSVAVAASPLSGPDPLAVTFSTSASGGEGGYTFSWDFGDGASSTLEDPAHTFSGAGTYTVAVTVHDSGGNTTATTISILVLGSGPAPTIRITAPTEGQVVSGAFRVTGTATNATLVEVSLDGGTTWSSASGTVGWSYEVGGLPEGDHAIQARASGPGGFTATQVTVTVPAGFPVVAVIALLVVVLLLLFVFLLWRRLRSRPGTDVEEAAARETTATPSPERDEPGEESVKSTETPEDR